MHLIKKCKHGVVHMQCRCWDRNKAVEIVPCMINNNGTLLHEKCKEEK